MPTKDGQIDKIMTELIEEPWDNFKRVMRGALLRAYNRGYEAGCVKAQEQMMEESDEIHSDI